MINATQKVILEIRPLPESNNYDYALISEGGETVGWLKRKPSKRMEVIMLDKSLEISGTVWDDDENGVINVKY